MLFESMLQDFSDKRLLTQCTFGEATSLLLRRLSIIIKMAFIAIILAAIISIIITFHLTGYFLIFGIAIAGVCLIFGIVVVTALLFSERRAQPPKVYKPSDKLVFNAAYAKRAHELYSAACNKVKNRKDERKDF